MKIKMIDLVINEEKYKGKVFNRVGLNSHLYKMKNDALMLSTNSGKTWKESNIEFNALRLIELEEISLSPYDRVIEEEYYYIDENLDVLSTIDYKTDNDNFHFESGNYFNQSSIASKVRNEILRNLTEIINYFKKSVDNKEN